MNRVCLYTVIREEGMMDRYISGNESQRNHAQGADGEALELKIPPLRSAGWWELLLEDGSR